MSNVILTDGEARVLGCLVEKQTTTPEYYPLSLNALVAACNQRNNRDPVVAFDEAAVVVAVDGLRDKRLAAMVSEAGALIPERSRSMLGGGSGNGGSAGAGGSGSGYRGGK